MLIFKTFDIIFKLLCGQVVPHHTAKVGIIILFNLWQFDSKNSAENTVVLQLLLLNGNI